MAPPIPPQRGSLRALFSAQVTDRPPDGPLMGEPKGGGFSTIDLEAMRGGIDRAGQAKAQDRAIGVLLLGCAVLAGAGCIGPGLEPPFRDGESAPVVAMNPSANAGSPGGSTSFGNASGPNAVPGTTNPPTTGVTPEPTQPVGAAGSSAAPMMMQPVPPAAGAGGAAMMPGEPAAAPDGGVAGNPNGFGLDFDPKCSDERAQALMADGLCSYPLPEGTEVDAATTRIALVSNGEFTSVERVDGPLDCALRSGGFYFDMDPPTRITLCTSSCLRAGAAAEMQVVLVQGCPAPEMPAPEAP